jgi:hypothetical protein
VNLSRPITVVINGRVAYEGITQPTVRTFLLEDSFKQDPRTLYPASRTFNIPPGNNEEKGPTVRLARIIHEHFYCNRRFAAATSLDEVARRLGRRARRSVRLSREATAQFRDEPP